MVVAPIFNQRPGLLERIRTGAPRPGPRVKARDLMNSSSIFFFSIRFADGYRSAIALIHSRLVATLSCLSILFSAMSIFDG